MMAWLMLAASFAQAPVAHTHRWLNLGGVSVQPSVLARLVVIIFAAHELARAQREGWSWRRLAVLAGATGVTAGLIVVEPDLGSAVLILVVVAGMAFIAGMPMRLLAAPGALAVAGFTAAVLASPYRMARIRAFIAGDAIGAAGWQTHQSLVAMGSGGLFGRGYGAGLQKLFFLPEPHTDFIFSITGEELGLAGILVLLGLVAVITWRGLRIASRQPTAQRGLLAFGLIFAFAVQSLIHMAVCLGLVPPKGIPLPLVSYGKFDLLVSLVTVGLLLNLSREVTA
jgi:cell division protein FtsW